LKVERFSGSIQGVSSSGNIVKDSSFIATNDEKLDSALSHVWVKELDKGRKAQGFVAFKVDDDVTQVEIKSSFFSKQKIIINL